MMSFPNRKDGPVQSASHSHDESLMRSAPWSSGRVGAHIIGATEFDLRRTHRSARVLPIWRWWMTAAVMLLASVVLAGVLVRALRWTVL